MTQLLLFISDLRKHARSYENELDTKLVAFAKLGNSFAQDMERLVNSYLIMIIMIVQMLLIIIHKMHINALVHI